ncbi:MAG TPA: hypothetical protein DCR14_17020, partial [Acidimicrobiaceae bacterium]|nr:hypothetical protein [Acidimicrobiaceae bacterium]
MPYTLAKWALWLIAAAIIGLIIGWMLGRLSAGRSGRTLADGAPDHVDSDDRFLPTDAAGSAGASAGSAAAAVGSAGRSATASPQMPSRAAEV